MVAYELAQHGYVQWLEQLASDSRNQVVRNNFKAAMAKLP